MHADETDEAAAAAAPETAAGEEAPGEETEAPIPGKPYLGRFATWLREARAAARLSQADLSEATGISKSWLSRIETGDNFPHEIDRDKLLLALGHAGSEPLNEGLGAWRADRKEIDHAATRGAYPHSQFLSQDQRRAQGKASRERLLQIVAEDMIVRGVAPLVTMVSERMGLTTGGALRHMRYLAREGLLGEVQSSKGTRYLQITPAGLAHVIQAGKESGEWAPPLADAAPLLRVLAGLLVAEGATSPLPIASCAAEAPTQEAPAPAAWAGPSFAEGSAIGTRPRSEQLVLWYVATTFGREKRVIPIEEVAEGTGLLPMEATEGARALIADELLHCDHSQGGALLPTFAGARWTVDSGWKDAALSLEGVSLATVPAPPPPPESVDDRPPVAPPAHETLTDQEKRVLAWMALAAVPVTEEQIAQGIGVPADSIYAACEALLDQNRVFFSKKDYTYVIVRP